MEMKYKQFIWLLIPGLIFLCCWKKQQHEITVPQTPVYSVSGTVLTSVNSMPLSDVTIHLSGKVKYLEEDSARVALFTAMTDSNGQFVFPNVPGGFGYEFAASKDGYVTNEQEYVLSYENRNIGNLILDRLLMKKSSHNYSRYLLTGITVRDGGTLWLADSLRNCFIELNPDFSIKGTTKQLSIKPVGLAYDGHAFWTVESYTDSLYQINNADDYTVTILARYGLPTNSANQWQAVKIAALHWNDQQIWAASNDAGNYYFSFRPGELTMDRHSAPVSKYAITGIGSRFDTIYLSLHSDNNQQISINQLFLLDIASDNVIGYYQAAEFIGHICIMDNSIITVNGVMLTVYNL
jgi:hypothetical protein